MEAHKVLGVSKNASEDQIRAAYKALAMKWHPDRQPHNRQEATAKFVEINEANRTMLRHLRRARREAAAKKVDSESKFPPSSPQSSAASLSPSTPESTSSCSESDSSRQSSESGHSAPSSSSSYSASSSTPSNRFDPREQSTSRSSSPPNPIPECPHSPPSEKCDKSSSNTSSPKRFRNKLRRQAGSRTCSEGSRTAECTPESSTSSLRSTLDRDPDRVVETLRPGRTLFHGTSADSAKQWVHVLHMSLEDIFRGKTYYFRIVRHTLSGRKRIVPVDVYVPPGTRTGTEIIVEDVGNERKDGTRQDICFLVKEMEHPRFTRIRDDLLMEVRLPWIDSLETEEGEVYLQGVDDMEYVFSVNYCADRLLSGTVTIPEAGMPRQNGVGRGKIVVRWEITSPASSWDSIKNILKPRNKSNTSQ